MKMRHGSLLYCRIHIILKTVQAEWQLQTVHITADQLADENGFDKEQIKSIRFVFDRLENGAVNLDNIAFVK